MTRTQRDLVVLFALGLLVNSVVAALIDQPGYTDAYYYFNGATFIANGQPLIEPYIWNYAAPPPALPTPAFNYWQPLTSFVGAFGIKLLPFVSEFDAAQVPFVILGSLLPPLAYMIAQEFGNRSDGLLAGSLMAFSGVYATYWSLPETFTPFAVATAGSLFLLSLGLRTEHRAYWLLSGVFCGLSHLTRADGLLLLLVVVGVIVMMGEGRTRRDRLIAAGLVGLGYLVVMMPWFLRNWSIYGSVQPPGGLSTLWLLDYNDLFQFPPEVTTSRYFAGGFQAIIQPKLRALWLNTLTFVIVQNLVFLVPFTLVGWIRRWRSPALVGATIYGLALFAAMTFGFTWPGVNGGWLHSGAALMPFIAAAGAVGLTDVIKWVARRRQGWNATEARRVFGIAAAGFALLITVYMIQTRIIGPAGLSRISWNQQNLVYTEIGEELRAQEIEQTIVIMVNNPPGFFTHTGYGGVPLPSGDEEMLLSAADAYQAAFLVVDQNVAPSLQSLYLNGPASERIKHLATYGAANQPVYLYQIDPPS